MAILLIFTNRIVQGTMGEICGGFSDAAWGQPSGKYKK